MKRLDPWKVQRVFEENLRGIRELQNGWFIALCPFHGDDHHSFSFNPEIGFARCFACGWKGGIKKFLLDLGYEEKKAKEILKACFTDEELKVEKPKAKPVKREPVKKEKQEKLPPPWEIYQRRTVYVYRLPDGTPIMKKYRYEDPKEEYKDKVNRKTFIVKWLTDERKSVFYGMDTLPKMGRTKSGKKVIFWTEGEKCLEALRKRTRGMGLLSFQNVDVEWKNSLPYIHGYIKEDAIHFIFADNDQVGRSKAEWLAKKLVEIGAEKVFIVDFGKERPTKWDIADELENGAKLKEVIKTFKKAYHPQAV